MLRNTELDSNYLVSFDSFETKVLTVGGSAFIKKKIYSLVSQTNVL